MNRIITICAAVLMTASMFAQSPEKMSYQAVVRDGSDALVTSAAVGMQISILQGTANGNAVYVETQTPTANANGLVSLEIGTGTVVSGDFSTIDWANGPYFIKTETDPSGGTNYSITGTSQLMSVPYALYAKESGSSNPPNLETVLTENNSANNQQIKDLADPTQDQDATTKAYVDGLLARIEVLEELNDGFTDTRDDKHYNVVKIGDQVWMAENLAYLPSVNRVASGSEDAAGSYYYVYGYDGTNVTDAKATANYSTYGVLYNWAAAMNGEKSSSSNPSEIQGVCPTGWHLPSDAEWTQLTDYLDGKNDAGGKLKETGIAHWTSPNIGATNETGFTALPGGYRYVNGTFYTIGDDGHWWSATESNASSAWFRYMNFNNSDVYRSTRFNDGKGDGSSVRCLRD